jgi:selenocysteine lyase/cysteine desulfurase
MRRVATWTRRDVLRTGAAFAAFNPPHLPRLVEATAGLAQRDPDDVARDEAYWTEVRRGFSLDATLINLNNGGVCPSPRGVHEAFKRRLDLSNQAPAHYMWEVLEPGIEGVRRALAADLAVDSECVAITRNASEALQIAQLGLDLRPGDEVLTTNQDYPRMLATWDQRARRDGVRVTQLSFPVPASQADLLQRFERALTPATRVLHFCHITNLTGQIFPVRELCALARARGIISIVDGAQAYAHFPFKIQEFDPDFYGTSLHKWLLAPVGTGFLYVRPDRVADHWPLQPAPAGATTIRKFEEIGTHPAANHHAIAEALTFHQGIGLERKAARLRYLRDRWALRLPADSRFTVHTSLAPADSCGIGTVALSGVPAGMLAARLWSERRILVSPITHPEFEGVRVTPNVYTTLQEIDVFADEMERAARGGG